MVIRVSCLKVWLCHMGFCRVEHVLSCSFWVLELSHFLSWFLLHTFHYNLLDLTFCTWYPVCTLVFPVTVASPLTHASVLM